jgi:toxin ParE1/3/4
MRIRWTEPAVADLTDISDYIEEHDSAASARRTALRLYESLTSLTQFPLRGRPGRKPGTRELVFPGLPYLAIYRVRDNVNEILRVLHGAQQWP